MRILATIICMSFIFSGELEVEGDLKVTGTIENDSLAQVISEQQEQISILQLLVVDLQAQITLLGYGLGAFDCNGMIGGDAVLDDCGVCDGDNSTCGITDIDGNHYFTI